MPKSHAHSAAAPERYEDIVRRLDEVVKLLENNEVSCKVCAGIGAVQNQPCTACDGRGKLPLPLEESLKAFEEGIGLVRKGEAKLNEAEQRVELLLGESAEPAGINTRVPFDPEKPRSDPSPYLEPAREPSGQTAKRPARLPPAAADDDVTF